MSKGTYTLTEGDLYAIHDKATRGKPTLAEANARAEKHIIRLGADPDGYEAHTVRDRIRMTITLR